MEDLLGTRPRRRRETQGRQCRDADGQSARPARRGQRDSTSEPVSNGWTFMQAYGRALRAARDAPSRATCGWTGGRWLCPLVRPDRINSDSSFVSNRLDTDFRLAAGLSGVVATSASIDSSCRYLTVDGVIPPALWVGSRRYPTVGFGRQLAERDQSGLVQGQNFLAGIPWSRR